LGQHSTALTSRSCLFSPLFFLEASFHSLSFLLPAPFHLPSFISASSVLIFPLHFLSLSPSFFTFIFFSFLSLSFSFISSSSPSFSSLFHPSPSALLSSFKPNIAAQRLPLFFAFWSSRSEILARMFVIGSQIDWLVLCKVKLSRYTPWRRLGAEEVQLLLILNLGTRWG
jgi:hypothetical protein